MKIIVTGGAGFIGSAVIRMLIERTDHSVVNLDKLTYAANLNSLAAIASSPRYRFAHLDICDRAGVSALMEQEKPDAIMHLAAESHVDRSIDGPDDFIATNVVGTYTLLECVRAYLAGAGRPRRAGFRFHHISTDEVFGSLGPTGAFTETTPYRPNSPYSASKAAADHLARAWHATYDLPIVVSNCSNNYGPFQFPEKLIPLMILNALHERPLPVYGDGGNVRDWLFVEDHAAALIEILTHGRVGESYNVGGSGEMTNRAVVEAICDEVDAVAERKPGATRSLITYVPDRPGHDRRYAIDTAKITVDLGWRPTVGFRDGLCRTIRWYQQNRAWWEPLTGGVFAGQRLGLPAAS